MYESMRKLVLDAANPDATEMFKELGLSYSVVLCKEEGGGEVDLVPMGSQYEVTPKNVIDFVRRYCEHRMRVTMEKPLRVSDTAMLFELQIFDLQFLTWLF